MKSWLPLTVGLLAIVIGGVWTLQGLGYLTGSVMTDQTIWAIVGPVVAVSGVAAVVIGLRGRRRQE